MDEGRLDSRRVNALGRRNLLVLAAIAILTVVAGVLRYSDAPAVPAFVVAGFALAGLAWVVSYATEQVGERFGPGVTGFLQSTLGNLPEFFIVIFALSAGELVVARNSIIGSLLANALLVLGLVLVVGASTAEDSVMRFSVRLPNDTATLLILANFIIVLTGLSLASEDRASSHIEGDLGGGGRAILFVYLGWVIRYLRSDERPDEPEPDEPAAALPLSVFRSGSSAVSGVGAAFVSDWFIHALDPAVEGAAHLQGLRGAGDRGDRRQRGGERHRPGARPARASRISRSPWSRTPSRRSPPSSSRRWCSSPCSSRPR